MEWSPDSRHLLIDGSGDIRIREPFSGREELLLPYMDHLLAHWSPDGMRIAALSQMPPEVRVWDARTGREVVRLRDPSASTQFEWRPDGRQVIAAGAQETSNPQSRLAVTQPVLVIWALPSGTKVRVLPDQRLQLEGSGIYRDPPSWSPNGRQLLTIGGDGRFHIWDGADWHEVRTLPSQSSGPATWSPDSQRLIVNEEGKARIWNVVTGKVVAVLRVQAFDTVWSPDGQRVLIADYSGGLRLYPAPVQGRTDGTGSIGPGQPGRAWNTSCHRWRSEPHLVEEVLLCQPIAPSFRKCSSASVPQLPRSSCQAFPQNSAPLA
jgi:WD40 repeat protein